MYQPALHAPCSWTTVLSHRYGSLGKRNVSSTHETGHCSKFSKAVLMKDEEGAQPLHEHFPHPTVQRAENVLNTLRTEVCAI